jgi:YVTN family beta-propeller protein
MPNAKHVHRALSAVALAMLSALPSACNHTPPPPPLVTDRLPTGKQIMEDPQGIPVDSLPVNMVLSPDGKFLISSASGFREALHSIRMADFTDQCELIQARTKTKSAGLYYGLVFGADGMLYVAQGAADTIAIIELDPDGKLHARGKLTARKGDFPSGLAADAHNHLFVANNNPSELPIPFFHPCSMSIYDIQTEEEIGRYEFTSHNNTPNFPLAITATSDGKKVYVASERDAAVYVLDASDPAHPKLAQTLPTGAHPDALLLNKSQNRLFVANAHSDTVSIVDTATDKIISTILLRPEVARDVPGATPTGLALSPDEKWLYVTLGDMNAVAVVDVKDNELEAYMPTGWYPMAAVVSPDGKHLMVANAKGSVQMNPNPKYTKEEERQNYILNILEGTISRFPTPAKQEFKELTDKAMKNAQLLNRPPLDHNPLAGIGIKSGNIQHVIYIVKENRTYDQILADMKEGNGDESLLLFGKDVTPNQHALSERFVLFDNFYDCGEVSGDGWAWSTQGMANEYVIRNVPYGYSNRGRKFDYEGVVDEYPTGGFPAKSPEGKRLSDDPRFKEGAPPIPDVAEAPGGHIWDLARKAGLSYRNYGFFLSHEIHKDNLKTGPIVIPDNYPSAVGLQPGGRDLEGISDLDFRRFDLDYPDSEAGQILKARTADPNFLWRRKTFGKAKSQSRFAEWKREFELMLSKDPSGRSVPAFQTIRFCTDHTGGLSALRHSPRGMVADNDFAVGQLVDAISHSPIWKSTAIFVIEDDAQGGPDHIDGHRSTCFVISPWIKKKSVDHSFNNTASVLRTMELLLGLPPMCQYDALAKPIMDWDITPSNDQPYEAILPRESYMKEINPKPSTTAPVEPVSPEQALRNLSDKMDFEHADAAPADILNDIIWKSVKGVGSTMPKSPGGPFVQPGAKHDDDD